ncbi:ABC1 kinase family protein [Kitasatospora sp. P5_F3]
MSELPKGTVRRSWKVASLPIGLAGRTAFGMARRLAGGAEEAIRAEIEERTARQVFAVIGELKGGAQKFAQMLSVMESALPEAMVRPYRAALTSLQESGPALPADIVHGVLSDQLGADWRKLMPEFTDRPVASASIGQVHRARWHDGREVAVKIQHPGAAEAIASDFGHLTRLGWLLERLTGNEMKVGETLAGLREQMAEELDYRQEAASQQLFADAFADDPDVLVPGVVEFTGRVLVTDWLAGTPMATVMAEGEQSDRDRLGLLLTRFLYAGPQRVGLLHADPHPGNFRLTDDGRLGVLDFGAVARLPDGLPSWIGAVMRAAVDEDPERMARVLQEAGLLRDRKKGGDQPEDFGWLLGAMAPMVRPFEAEVFAFDREWMREAVRQATLSKEADMLRSRMQVPPDQALAQRVWMGKLAMLSQLGARIPFRAEACRGLPGFEPAATSPG